MKILIFAAGILILIFAEIARVYYIMPFPGSQVSDTIDLAYFLSKSINIWRALGAGLIAYPLIQFYKGKNPYLKWTSLALVVFYLFIFYSFNFRFEADAMFYQPHHKILVKTNTNKMPLKNLVIGVALNGEAKAYPIEIIGYHHQVRDTVGGEPVMITYCTVCRTGRVFRPLVDNKPETFRLVGMDHFNAMFEDHSTKSWWRQATGEAISGPLRGKKLPEVHSEQMTLEAWLLRYPDSWIMQPDQEFNDQYKGLERYDEGKTKGKLTRADSLSWHDKSWVVGVPSGLFAKAYDWNDLIRLRTINDDIAGTPLVVVLENDAASFHVWSRRVGNDTLSFEVADTGDLKDSKTYSKWDWKGNCTDGPLKGSSLIPLDGYQEFWHSWKTFHPQTTQYQPKNN